jgi:hypothetical protein
MAGRGRGISVHELTSLRLNTRGERVTSRSSSNSKRKQTAGELDGRGNIITASLPLAGKKRPRPSVAPGDDEREKEAEKEKEYHEENIVQRLRKKRKRDSYYQKLLPSLGEGTSSSAPLFVNVSQVSNHDPSGTNGRPSSDLLKTIHHFASCYYDQRGLLNDASKSSRGRISTLGEQAALKPMNSSPKDRHQSETETETNSASEKGGTKRPSDDQEESTNSTSTRQWGSSKSLSESRSDSPRKPGQRKSARIKNMYRALDGSALVAIG